MQNYGNDKKETAIYLNSRIIGEIKMELSQVMKERRSVRSFKDTPVSSEIIDNILEKASLAPETDNCNYYFGVIKDTDVKNQLAKATLWADWIAKAPVLFVCCGDISSDLKNLNDNDYSVVGTKYRYGEEVVNFLREHKDRKACKKLLLASPVYIAAQHIILTAVSHGLRGCIVDFMDLEKINHILGLPEHITCQVVVPVGYSNEIPKQKDKFSIDDRVFYNHWDK